MAGEWHWTPLSTAVSDYLSGLQGRRSRVFCGHGDACPSYGDLNNVRAGPTRLYRRPLCDTATISRRSQQVVNRRAEIFFSCAWDEPMGDLLRVAARTSERHLTVHRMCSLRKPRRSVLPDSCDYFLSAVWVYRPLQSIRHTGSAQVHCHTTINCVSRRYLLPPESEADAPSRTSSARWTTRSS